MIGKKYGGRQKGTPNKVSDRIKPILETLSLSLLNSIEVDKLSIRERLELLKITIGYTLPKLKQIDSHSFENEPPLVINLGNGTPPKKIDL